MGSAVASVVVPAHDEQQGIGRLLDALTGREGLEVVVVANGCSDATAEVARAVPGVRVLETPTPSKWRAMRLGDTVAATFPRVYVDADVLIDHDSILALTRALDETVLAAGPEREVSSGSSSVPVRWYYDVWEQLPQVRAGLFGRGVIALSERGHERLRDLPEVLSDDLAFSESFDSRERSIVRDAVVVEIPPRHMRDLMRRRVRMVTGVAQAEQQGLLSSSARTHLPDLVRMAGRTPSLAYKLPVFVWVTLVSRLRARRAVQNADFTTWLRDESSRAAV